MDKAGNKFCVMVTALSVKGRNLHQGEIVEDSTLDDLKDLLLQAGLIRRAEELSLVKTAPVAA